MRLVAFFLWAEKIDANLKFVCEAQSWSQAVVSLA